MSWIGVDLDGTLARYDGWQGIEHIGEPIPKMLERIKRWRKEGKEVKIFTARVSKQALRANKVTMGRVLLPIKRWCFEHLGEYLEVTCEKDLQMVELWDDRCIQVVPNTGEVVGERPSSDCKKDVG